MITFTMPKYLPCLRCGTSKIVLLISEAYPGRKLYQCECENGHSWNEWCDTPEEARNAWNERPVVVITTAQSSEDKGERE